MTTARNRARYGRGSSFVTPAYSAAESLLSGEMEPYDHAVLRSNRASSAELQVRLRGSNTPPHGCASQRPLPGHSIILRSVSTVLPARGSDERPALTRLPGLCVLRGP